MDSTTKVLLAITNLDPTILIDLEEIRIDVETMEKEHGPMSDEDIISYVEQYIVAHPKFT